MRVYVPLDLGEATTTEITNLNKEILCEIKISLTDLKCIRLQSFD